MRRPRRYKQPQRTNNIHGWAIIGMLATVSIAFLWLLYKYLEVAR